MPGPPNWISRLFDNPAFLEMTLSRWKEKRPALEAFVNAGIDIYAHRLAAAQQRNFQRWPILNTYVWPNQVVTGSYKGEVSWLKDWLKKCAEESLKGSTVVALLPF